MISGPFFDSVPHDLLLKAVAHHTDERWVLLYLERWLKAPMQMPDGTLVAREKGTPQGSPISPLITNLWLGAAIRHTLGLPQSSEHPRYYMNRTRAPGRLNSTARYALVDPTALRSSRPDCTGQRRGGEIRGSRAVSI